MRRFSLYIFILTLCLLTGECVSKKPQIPEIFNKAPKYRQKYVKLEKAYEIDVTNINLFSKEYEFSNFIDFDSHHNMYVLDSYRGIISVFDDKGNLVREFGGQGQGPNEFENSNRLIIKDDKIYVFQGLFSLKVLSLDGQYIEKRNIFIENPLKIKAGGDKFFLLRGKTDRTFTDLTLILSLTDETFSKGEEIFRYESPLGLNGPPCWNWLFISESGEFFFPIENLNKYSITKYDRNGQPLMRFGREYQMQKYSEKAIQEINKMFKKAIEKGEMKVLDSPPIVRTMFEDLKRNIWVVSGETYEDNLIPNYENTVDIFNERGEWLHSFKTSFVSKNSFFHNGYIFRVLPIDTENFTQFIEVYKVEYLAE